MTVDSPAVPAGSAPRVLLFTPLQRVLALITAAVLLAAVCALIFGPARGARSDIGHVRVDLSSSRKGIYGVLATTRKTLGATTATLAQVEQSLKVQKQGLSIATTSQKLVGQTAGNTSNLLAQTDATLATVRQIDAALAPLQTLKGDLPTVVASVQAGVTLARSTLSLARQTLSTGQAALAVAQTTLSTLRDSKQIQQQLLDVARTILAQTRAINRKIPLPAVFPASLAAQHSGH